MSVMQQQRRKLTNYWPRFELRKKQMRAVRKERKRIEKEMAEKSAEDRQRAVDAALALQASKKPRTWRKLLDKVAAVRNRALESRPEPQAANRVRPAKLNLAFWRKGS